MNTLHFKLGDKVRSIVFWAIGTIDGEGNKLTRNISPQDVYVITGFKLNKSSGLCLRLRGVEIPFYHRHFTFVKRGNTNSVKEMTDNIASKICLM